MKKRNSLIIIASIVLLLLVVFGTWYFSVSEHWKLIDAFYFTIMTITTVGYGDLVPTHDTSKIITSIYSVVSIPMILFVFGVVAESYFESKMKGLEKRLYGIMNEEKEIEAAIDETESRIEASEG